MTTHELQRFGSVSPGEALPLLILPGPVAFESVRKAQKGGGTHPFETMAVALWWGSIYCGGQHNQCVACDHEFFLTNTEIDVPSYIAVLRGGENALVCALCSACGEGKTAEQAGEIFANVISRDMVVVPAEPDA